MKCLKAGRWQRRVNQLLREKFGDCDEVGMKVIKEMKAKGLVIGKDFVVVRGTCMIDGKAQGHFCIELWGKNCPDKDGKPVFKINGFRVGTAVRLPMTNMWKGLYREA